MTDQKEVQSIVKHVSSFLNCDGVKLVYATTDNGDWHIYCATAAHARSLQASVQCHLDWKIKTLPDAVTDHSIHTSSNTLSGALANLKTVVTEHTRFYNEYHHSLAKKHLGCETLDASYMWSVNGNAFHLFIATDEYLAKVHMNALECNEQVARHLNAETTDQFIHIVGFDIQDVLTQLGVMCNVKGS